MPDVPASILDKQLLHDFPDRAVRRLLENTANLRDLVMAVAPDLAAGFDFAHAEPVHPREFLLEDWRRRESDLLFRVPFRDQSDARPVLVCVLVEHQSRPDPQMPLRLLLYAVLYWEREWKSWEESKTGSALTLSPVVPIVFHTGNTRWTKQRQLLDLLEGPEALRQLAPQWRVFFWDLAERTPEELLQQASQWLRALAVVRAENENRETFESVLRQVLHGLESLADQEKVRWHELVTFVLSWALRRRPAEEKPSIQSIAVESHEDRLRKKEVQKMSETLTQTWEQWVLERGLTQGKAEGELATLRENLNIVLEERFGELPAELAEKIQGVTDVAKLRQSLRQALHIRSLDELQL